MTVKYEIWLDDPYGNRMTLLDTIMGLGIARVANAIGAWSLVLPGSFDQSLLREDAVVEFWRAPQDGALTWISAGFLRKWRYVTGGDEGEHIEISGPDANDLLRRRIVAYAAASSQAEKTDQADDMMKAIVRENLGSSAAAGRDLSSLSFSVAADLGLGPSITKSFAWKKMIDVLREIGQSAEEAGTSVYFDVAPLAASATTVGFEFRTYTNQRGADHSIDSENPVFFGKEWGNLDEPLLEYDYEDEITYVYAGGQGEEAARVIEEVSDSDRVSASPWNRCEAFADARSEGDTDGVIAKGNAVLNEGRPMIRFSGKLLDTEQARFGVHWGFGDKVEISYRGVQFAGMVKAVTIKLDEKGAEDVSARVEAVL